MKICSKTHQIAPLKKMFTGKHAHDPLANAWLRHGSQATLRHATRSSPQNDGPLLANPTYAHGLLLRNLFEEMDSTLADR